MPAHLKNLKLDRPLAVLDIESTGLDPKNARIVELAVLRFAPDDQPDRYRHCSEGGQVIPFRHRLDPGVPIPPAAAAIHKITDADVTGQPTFRAIGCQLARFLEGCDLAGYNVARFDLPLLCAEFDRAGVEFSLDGRRIVDLMPLFHKLQPRDLAAAVRHYVGREHEGAHGAFADAAGAAAVLDGMLAHHPDLPRSIADLHERTTEADTRRWFVAEGGPLVFAKGKHRGRELEEVAHAEQGYLRWMLGLDLLPVDRLTVERALDTRADRG